MAVGGCHLPCASCARNGSARHSSSRRRRPPQYRPSRRGSNRHRRTRPCWTKCTPSSQCWPEWSADSRRRAPPRGRHWRCAPFQQRVSQSTVNVAQTLRQQRAAPRTFQHVPRAVPAYLLDDVAVDNLVDLVELERRIARRQAVQSVASQLPAQEILVASARHLKRRAAERDRRRV